jgi:hypothetical protein
VVSFILWLLHPRPPLHPAFLWRKNTFFIFNRRLTGAKSHLGFSGEEINLLFLLAIES